MSDLTRQRAPTLWPAIGFATGLSVLGHWAVVMGALVDAAGDATAMAKGFVILGLAVLPLSVVVGGRRAGQQWDQVGRATAAGAVVFILTAILAAEAVPITAIVAGLGAGAVVAMPASAPSRRWVRIVVLAMDVIYVYVVVRVAPSFAIIVAPLLPFTSIGVADYVARLWWAPSAGNRPGTG